MFEECPEVTFLLRTWINGGSALAAVRMLIENGYGFEAATTANVALHRPECEDREALLGAIGEVAQTSEAWVEALREFAQDPSEERWDGLFRFAPEEVFYQRLRHTIAILMALGCEGNILFRCATKHGMTTDAFDLARSGTVDPATIAERGNGSPARSAWLGLAAQAAFARGDRWNTVGYLREACRDDETAFLAWASISEIREEADDELKSQLDALDVPLV
jgi:hypothetical protein